MSAPLPAPERLERIEMLTFSDEHAGAPAEVARALGLGFDRFGGAIAGWATRLYVLMFNRAFGIGQASPATEDEIRAVTARLDREGVPRSFLQIAPGARPDRLPDWLPPHGYAPYNRWAKFARALTDLPPIQNGVRVERIGREHADTFARVDVEAFRLPPPLLPWETALVGRPRWRHYLAHLDDDIVGCAALFVDEGMAWLGHAGTLERARGRGIQGALIARRLADAAELGCGHAVVETAVDTPEKPAPSYRNQLRHGFQLCYLRENYLRKRPSDS
jgi:GNAT superfamily N-acetyltransferase